MGGPHVLTITKIHEGKWDRAIFEFLVKHRAAFQPPYPSAAALLRAPDRGHAEAYAKSINQYVAERRPGGYAVLVELIADVEDDR